MVIRPPLVSVLALMVALIGACDAAEEAEPEAPTLSPEDVVSELETDALLVFCEHASAALSEVNVASSDPEPMCVGQGLAARFGGDGEVSTCEAARDACLEEMSGTSEGFFVPMSCTNEANVTGSLGNCEFTIAEFDACSAAVLSSMEALKAALRCDISNDEAMALEGTADSGMPPECALVEEACPTLFIDLPDTH